MRPIYLTFDDGPDAEWTPPILELLAQYGAKATFFMIGQQACREPALARRVLAAGHALGNHTWSHRHPWTLTSRQARQEVRDGSKAIADATGWQPRLFRPPHGRWHPGMVQEARAHGQSTVLWHRTALDWGRLGTATGIQRRLLRTQDDDIVLMHDGMRRANRPDHLISVLPRVLAEFQRRQLTLVPLP